MALTTTNGMSVDGLDAAPNGPGLAQQLGNQVDEFYGKSVANAAALPASGEFPGQRVWLVDVKGWGVWDGSAWVTDTAWVAPSLGSSWTIVDATFSAPSYRRKDGWVVMKGFMTGGGSGTAFTLPPGMRPLKVEPFVALAGFGSQTCQIRVSPIGEVAVSSYGASANNQGVSLNSIRFLAEQ